MPLLAEGVCAWRGGGAKDWLLIAETRWWLGLMGDALRIVSIVANSKAQEGERLVPEMMD